MMFVSKVKPRRVRLSSNDDIHADDLEEENDATHKLVYRVDCEGVKGFSLAMSRSLGDFMLKLRADLEPNEQIVSPNMYQNVCAVDFKGQFRR
jgi:hypothetical protein